MHLHSEFLEFFVIQGNLDVTKGQRSAKYVRYKEVQLYRGCLYFSITRDGAKNTVCYTDDFVKQRLVKSRFLCTQSKTLLPLIYKGTAFKITRLMRMQKAIDQFKLLFVARTFSPSCKHRMFVYRLERMRLLTSLHTCHPLVLTPQAVAVSRLKS